MKAQECTTTQCSGCGEIKPRGEFDTNRKTRKCKQCEALMSRQRYLRNREKVLERGAIRRVEKAAEIQSAMADWYVRNREHVLTRCKEYNGRPEVKARERERQRLRYAARRDEILASRKAYYARNPEAAKRLGEYSRRHSRENREMYAAKRAKRRSMLLKAMPKWADKSAIKRIYLLARELTEKTGVDHHVDHIVPLKGRNVCGLHVEYNLRVIPGTDNLRKSNKLG